jgi:glycosyltransferase involved in cell wall biosynthesis
MANYISEYPLPVHHNPDLIHYENHPVSTHRPSPDQFTYNPQARHHAEPVVLIITAANNPRDVIMETAASLFHQSLTNWEWVIVDDRTDNPASLELLRQIALDPRVTILKNPGKSGLPAARNAALEYALSKKYVPPYFLSLDDDDLFELTALEKVVWMLESSSEWSIGGFPFIKFAAQNVTETRGLHNGKENYAVVSSLVHLI